MTKHQSPATVSADHVPGPVLHVLRGPYITYRGLRHEIPEGSKRLLVFIALHGGRVERRHAAGLLWPIGNDARAAGNLRSSLWRLRGVGIDLLQVDKWSIDLCGHVAVDLRLIRDWASRLITGTPLPEDLMLNRSWTDSLDLLPGWYDDWALMERERLRQRVLHGLEALSGELLRRRRCAEAVEAALAAVSAEPLRESAQRTLLEAHLGEGNWIEAHRAFDSYRGMLERELGVEPSAGFSTLLWPTASDHGVLVPHHATL
jgi:DNA-binding SARP family transcriptional activator